MTIGGLIKQNRISKKLTQKELGSIMNVTKQTIAAYENGTRTPSNEMIKRFASALDMDLSEFLTCSNILEVSTKKNEHFFHMVNQLSMYLNRLLEYLNDNTINTESVFYNESIFSTFEEILYELTSFYQLYIPGLKTLTFQSDINRKTFMNIESSLEILNDLGKQEAAKRIEELTQIPKYTANTENQNNSDQQN